MQETWEAVTQVWGKCPREWLTEKTAKIQHVPRMASPLHVPHFDRCPGELAGTVGGLGTLVF